MATQDIPRFKKTPATGSDAGNTAIIDSNIKAVDRIAIPANETNTFNGGKAENGVINLSRNSDGDLVFNSYADGVWTEYLAVLDGLKSVGGITLDGNEVTVVAPVKWRINSVNYQKLTNTVITVNSATDGFKRIDYIYANTSNNILLIEGTEVADGNPYIPPTLPANTVMVAPVYISGDTVVQPIPDLSDYITKMEAYNNFIYASPAIPQTANIELFGRILADDIQSRTQITAQSASIITNLLVNKIISNGLGTFEIDSLGGDFYLSGLRKIIRGGKLMGEELFTVTDLKDYVQVGNVVLKQQKVVYADDYVDEFTGWNDDDFNEGSAIWKILNENDFKDVDIRFTRKTYKPWMGATSIKNISNVSFTGVGQPSFIEGLTHLEGGTILQGTWRLIQPVNDFFMSNLGIDVGRDVTDTYYGGVSVEGFTNSYRLGVDNEWGKNRNYENITILMRNSSDPVHVFLEERGNGVQVDNIRLFGGQHGLTIKSKTVNIGRVECYGQGGEYVIIKAGEVDTDTSDIYIGSVIAGKLPPEVESAYYTIPNVAFGCYLDAQLPLTNINIGSLQISDAEHGLEFSSKSGNIIGAVNIQSVTLNRCNYGIVRSGSGKLSYINIGQTSIFSSTSAAVFFTEGNGLDNGIKIQSLTTGSMTVGTGVYMRNSTKIEIDSFNANYITNSFDINAGCELILNSYTVGENVANFKEASSLNPTRRGIYKDANDHINESLTVVGLVAAVTSVNNTGVLFGSDVGVGVLQGRNYDNTQAVPLAIQPFGIEPTFFGSLVSISSAKYQFNGSLSSASLSGTGTRPVAAQADGTLGIDTNTYQIVLSDGAFSHASPPVNNSTGKKGSVWYDPVNKDRYDWIADNVVARYFADPTF